MFSKYENESKNDRLIRVIVGALIVLSSFILSTGALQVILLALAFVLLFTGLTGFCPLYRLLGIKTKK